VHIRAGDLLEGYFDAHGEYHTSISTASSSGVGMRTPFPTAFYISAMKNVWRSNPLIATSFIFEDKNHPAYSMLDFLQIKHDVELYVGRDLLKDVVDLTCSTEMISSRGSFFYAVALRHRQQKIHFLSPSEISPYRCHLPSKQGYYLLNDAEYHTLVAEETWRNDVTQRDLLNRDFAVGFSRCTTCLRSSQCVL